MQEAINKIKSWYKKSSGAQVSFQKKGIKPRKDWSVMLFIVFAIILVMAGFSYFFYVKVDNGTFFTINEEDKIIEIKINNSLLDKITADVREREETLAELKSGKLIPANPAL